MRQILAGGPNIGPFKYFSNGLKLSAFNSTTPFTISDTIVDGSATTPFADISGIWNTTGSPTAIKLNVTDTASATVTQNGGPYLLDLQVSGVSKFAVSKTGTLQFGPLRASLYRAVMFGSATSSELIGVARNDTGVAGTQASVAFGSHNNASINGFFLGAACALAWCAGSYADAGATSATYDIQLWRLSAGSIYQRSGTTAQSYYLGNTYTDASNYERAKFGWATNVLEIGPEAAGTGTLRTIKLLTNVGLATAPTATSLLSIAAGTTAKSQLNLASSTAPTSPVNGDIWFDGTNLKIQVSGVTKTVTIA